ncbi:MAG: L-seryl-tRNA(Sec) selenium transferase [Planctomycetota bacterium]|jgi:L-seryl-tRNA(Ser) seleniumtransferase
MLRDLPSVNELLEHSLLLDLIAEHGRASVLKWARTAVAARRHELLDRQRGGETANSVSRDQLRDQIAEAVVRLAEQSEWQQIGNVINATGVVLHTSLGRSPLSAAARQALLDCAAACNCEVDVETGGRRYRGYQVDPALKTLTGAEASLVVNNNAAATLLTLQALCAGKEVIISRGELIEIGGSFRLPEIFELSGAKLREVGTTNRTKLVDYERAINDDTAAIMVVHPSNYRVVGFSEKPDPAELFALARERGVISIDDIGSGALFDVTQAGLPAEPTFQNSVSAGADVTLGSGDKLLGGPQCGIIVGGAEVVGRVRNHPLARAVRVDKLTLAALGATLTAYLRGVEESEIPTLTLLRTSADDLQQRAEAALDEIGGVDGLCIEVRSATAQVGGGSLPAVELPTFVLALRHEILSADELARQLRIGRIRVFSRIQSDDVLLDLRSVLPEDTSRLALAVRLLAKNS